MGSIPYTFVTDQVEDYLDALAATGLFGESVGDVVERLISEGVQRAISGGLIRLQAPKEEAEDETPPATAGSPTYGYTVTAVESGALTGPHCTHVKSDFGCAEPGCKGEEIPF